MTITLELTAPPAKHDSPQADLVRIVTREGRMEARRPLTGAVLAIAERRGAHHDDEWIGWAITAPGQEPQVVISPVLARQILTEYGVAALTRCARCGQERTLPARGLCNPCGATTGRNGTRDIYPRQYNRLADVVEDYEYLQAAGEPDDAIAERLGYANRYSLFAALHRAGAR